MMDIVFPNGNEKDLLAMATKLGIEIIPFYEIADSSAYKKLSGRFGQIITDKTSKFFPVPKVMLTVREPRFAFERSKADIVFNLENDPHKDYLHHRASGLNQVIANIAHEKKKTIGVLFSSLTDPVSIGRVQQNMMLARKSKVDCILVSGARTPYELRSKYELQALASLLGHPLRIGANI